MATTRDRQGGDRFPEGVGRMSGGLGRGRVNPQLGAPRRIPAKPGWDECATRQPGGQRGSYLLTQVAGCAGGWWRRWRAGVVALVLVVTVLCGQPTLAYGMGNGANHPSAPPAATVPQGKANHASATLGTRPVAHQPPKIKNVPGYKPLAQQPPMAHGFVPSMKQAKVTLSPTTGTAFVGSDGKLEIDVSAAAITAADVAAAGGQIVMQVTEVAPPGGGNAGGMGVVSFGSYEVQLLDAHGNLLTHGLRVPATLKLHYGTVGGAEMSRAFVTFNGAHNKAITDLGPAWTQQATNDGANQTLQVTLPADTSAATQATPTPTPAASPTVTSTVTSTVTAAATPTSSGTATATPTAPATATATGPAPATATPTASGATTPTGGGNPKLVLGPTQQCQCSLPNTLFTWDTQSPVAKFGNPDPFNVDLNAGSLTEGTQIDVPPGPAGAMPNITLAYNSAAVNESHSPQGAAGWVGEGWSMTLGSISWSEHQVLANTCTNGGTCSSVNWEDSWMLNDPFGTSTELIPPNNGTATSYEDSPNYYCVASSSATPCPIQFQTARQTYAKVYAYVGPNQIPGTNPAQNYLCFRVYLANGVMEEFGCTADSLQFYPIQAKSQPGQTNQDIYYPVNWMLDLITNPQGDQVQITYQSDYEPSPDHLNYTRDLVQNAQQRCTGAQWQPLYQVQFAASHHTVARLTNTPSNCNTGSSVRCDDPLDLSGSGGLGAPLVNGTFVLNDINVQVNTSSENGGTYNSSAWNTLRDYQLSYEQSGPGTLAHDPLTSLAESTAGYLDLMQVKEVGDDGTTAYPPMTYSYTSQTEYYEDGAYTPYSTTYCGQSWNTGGNGGTCDLWSQTYDGNSRYLATANNGQGLQQSFAWADARDNTHGANTGGNPLNPLACNDSNGNPIGGYPCDEADDQAWSRIVLTGRTDTVTQLTQAGQGGQQTSLAVNSPYTYTYALTQLTAKECQDCANGMYWGNQNDGDYLDYYNGLFMGFNEAIVTNPDGSSVTHTYYTTLGWGVYDTSLVTSCPSTLPPFNTNNPCNPSPWWDVHNAGHGLETDTLYKDANGNPLKEVVNSYTKVCPAGGASATPAYTVGGTTYGPWDGNQVAELDHNNPVAVCDVQLTEAKTITWDGQTSNQVWDKEDYVYDSAGRVTKQTSTSNGGGASPTQIVQDTSYSTASAFNSLHLPGTVSGTNTVQESGWTGGAYLLDLVASTDTQDGSNNKTSCSAANYGTTYGTSNNTIGAPIESDSYTSCGGTANKTTMAYDNLGNQTSTTDPDGHAGAAGTACAGATSCTSYGDATQAVTTKSANDANQSTSSTQTYNAADGFGQWPASSTDANNVTTNYVYDALGRTLQVQTNGQVTPPTQQSWYYDSVCVGAGGGPPCFAEVDTAQRLNSSSTALTRQFYDGQGRLVETRKEAPGGQDTVQYTLYNVMGQASQQSVSYFVAAYAGSGGVAAAFSLPDTQQSVTLTTYDGLGRTLAVEDPLSATSTLAYSVVCSPPGTGGDTGCYEQTLALDANQHQSGTLTDGLGRQIYAQEYTGNAGPYGLYATTVTQYDTSGRTVQQTHADGSVTTTSYNADGTVASSSDPDQGAMTYGYDPNGNQTEQQDARGASGTTYTGYDGLNRPVWRNTANNASGAYVTYSYDSGMPGSAGTGRLTAEVFRGSAGTGATTFSGAYTYSYDALGRTTRVDQTMGGADGCPASWTCQDIGSPAQAGSQSAAGDGVWTVTGEGSDIWGSSDQFHYVSQALPGDGTLAAHVDSQTVTGTYPKAGLMVRGSSAANAANYLVSVTPTNTIYVQYRDSAGASEATQATLTASAPVWLALARSGTTYSAYTSPNGTSWTLIPGSIRSMPNLSGTVLDGIAVSSFNATAASLATFDSVSTTTGGTGACPTSWSCQDIGSPTPAGTQNYLGSGEWTMVGGGADIWGTSDQFHYVSQAQAGDGSLSTRVEAQGNSNAWAKGGVMMRSATTAGAAQYALLVTPSNGVVVEDRSSAGGSSTIVVSQATYTLPLYLKITRSGGTTYSAYTSPDGVTWTALSGATVTLSALSGTIQAGIAVTSHNTSASSTVTVDSVTPSFTPPSGVVVTPLPTAIGTTSYPISQSYDDAGAPLTTTYPDGETVTTSYTAQDWLSSVSTTQNGTTTNLLSNASYSGAGGASQEMTGASLANGVYSESLSYDAMARPTETSINRVSDSALMFDSRRAYDPVGNVADVWTTLPSGTDYQAFCYDEQNRLTYATSATTASLPCGGSWTAGSLSQAAYTHAYTYGVSNQLSSGPSGSYTYGDSSHADAATAVGTFYTAAYDAAGNMICRSLVRGQTCTRGGGFGAELSYDNEDRLTAWQNAWFNPTLSTQDLYDGEGNRVEQYVANGPTTTLVTYVANVEELSTTAGVTSTTTSYYAGGKRFAQAVNGVLSYLGSDGVGSAEVALDGSGNVQASALYDPYGGTRYSNGVMPGTYGFTGQRADSTTGLDYYNARYYDAVAGQFTSADSVQDGLNRYAYVKGNPETLIDPSGHRIACDQGGCAGTGTGSGSGTGRGNGSGSDGSTKTCANCLSALVPADGGDDPATDAYGPCGHTRPCQFGGDPHGLLDLAGYHHDTLVAYGQEGLDLLIGVDEDIWGYGASSISSWAAGGPTATTLGGCGAGAGIGALLGGAAGAAVGCGFGAAFGFIGWAATNSDVTAIEQNIADVHEELKDFYPQMVAMDANLGIVLEEYPNGGEYFLPFGILAVRTCGQCGACPSEHTG